MAKPKRKRKAPEIIRDDVTPERAAKNGFASIGMARRVVPVIDILHGEGSITAAEHANLTYFRDQASLADKSPVKSCIDFSPKGGHGPGVAIISAMRETWRMERDLGALADIARAVAVDDKSLTQWCIERYGGREKAGRIVICGNDKTVARRMAQARLELRYAAGMIVVPVYPLDPR